MKFIAFFEACPEELDKFIESWRERMPSERGVKIVFSPHTLAEQYNGITGFVIFESEDIKETRDYLMKYKRLNRRSLENRC